MNRLSQSLSRGLARVTEAALGPYQSAVIRIGFAGTWLFFLLREFPHRQELYGPSGPWDWGMGRRLTEDNHAFTALMWSDGQLWFECFYTLAILASAALLLGWRTRTASVLFMVGVLSLQNRSVFVGDGGDNVLHLMAIYLVFTRCGQVWSLDARRRARGERAPSDRFSSDRVPTGDAPTDRTPADRVGPLLWAVLGLALITVTATGRLFGNAWLIPVLLWTVWVALGLWWLVQRLARSPEPRVLLDVIANVLHNGALVVIMAEACLIYATAGWYKIQGSRWQDGTAVYYPLHLDYFTPWPGLADLMSTSGTILMIVAYGTVMVQVAFPFTLLDRRVKNVLLVLLMLEHSVIAVVLGLPFFSLAMITADAVFLPTSFLRRVGALATRARGRFVEDDDHGDGRDIGGDTGRDIGGGEDGTVPAPRSPEDSAPGPVGFTA
ncbi:HTTM domain-containing protein [Streptomyces hygroscopicus subsp. hygroscopicus]|uniref:HTTM domain-containing protein n=1 Tax=Streptomyces sp. KHY 26 TaxID=3097359 RepID=UPI0024A44A5B|nr:HTTM domain-containing protein [Streptomyces hygroscopicus]GLX49920.1 HTTM domain-containing protein [Streptomyces hygroscopicus subsp. hygroscopicus]